MRWTRLIFSLFLTTGTVATAFGQDGELPEPFVRITLVPPAAMDEDLVTPRGVNRGFDSLDDICVDASPPSGMMPEDVSHEFFPDKTISIEDVREQRDWPITVFHWEATAFYHQPLYFDHVALESYGQSIKPRLQPVLSGARFFATVPLLPVKVIRTPPHVHISTLGQGHFWENTRIDEHDAQASAFRRK